MKMLTIKNVREISYMRQSGKILAGVFKVIRENLREGITTGELDRIAEEYILANGATPTFKGYSGFPGSICVSVNEELLHGIPSRRVLKNGDIVSVDVGVNYMGYNTDAARTMCIGEVSDEAKKVIRVARDSFFEGIKYATEKNRLHDISCAIGAHIEANGCGIVRDYVGHGVGANLHEEPDIPNFGRPNTGIRLRRGMTLAIEPMVNAGSEEVEVLDDGWTVVTADGRLCAHYENTIVITEGEPEILTLEDGENA